MPLRKIPLISGEVYHVFNRTVSRELLFHSRREYTYFIRSFEYYHFCEPPIRFSRYLETEKDTRIDWLISLYLTGKTLVDIYAFCLMPNHFHFLLKQNTDGGISNFTRLLQNSYARYLNIKMARHGSLFQSPFKAVRVTKDAELLHVARYIHLNPLTSFVIKDFSELQGYEWSSYGDYVSEIGRRFIKSSPILDMYKDKTELIAFTKDNMDHKRDLDEIKHILID